MNAVACYSTLHGRLPLENNNHNLLFVLNVDKKL